MYTIQTFNLHFFSLVGELGNFSVFHVHFLFVFLTELSLNVPFLLWLRSIFTIIGTF